jgi:hypothetical protein
MMYRKPYATRPRRHFETCRRCGTRYVEFSDPRAPLGLCPSCAPSAAMAKNRPVTDWWENYWRGRADDPLRGKEENAKRP